MLTAGFGSAESEEFNLGGATRSTGSGTGANLQVVTHDQAALEDAVISGLIEGAYAETQVLGYEIVHTITARRR